MQCHCPVNHILIANYTRVKHNQKRNDSQKSHVLFVE
eukprot:UN10353